MLWQWGSGAGRGQGRGCRGCGEGLRGGSLGKDGGVVRGGWGRAVPQREGCHREEACQCCGQGYASLATCHGAHCGRGFLLLTAVGAILLQQLFYVLIGICIHCIFSLKNVYVRLMMVSTLEAERPVREAISLVLRFSMNLRRTICCWIGES